MEDLIIIGGWILLIFLFFLILIPRFRLYVGEERQVSYSRKERGISLGIWITGAGLFILCWIIRKILSIGDVIFSFKILFALSFGTFLLYKTWLWQKKGVVELKIFRMFYGPYGRPDISGSYYPCWKSEEPKMFWLLLIGWFIVGLMMLLLGIIYAVLLIV